MPAAIDPFLNQSTVGLYSITAWQLCLESVWYQFDPEELLHLSVGRLSDPNFIGEWYFNESGLYELWLSTSNSTHNTIECHWQGPPIDYHYEVNGYSEDYLEYAGTFKLLSFPFENGTATAMTDLSTQQSNTHLYRPPTVRAYIGPALDAVGVLPVVAYTSIVSDTGDWLYKGVSLLSLSAPVAPFALYG